MATSTQKSMIGWMIVLVLFVGAAAVFSMLQPPEGLHTKGLAQITSSPSFGGGNGSKRGPASVDASTAPDSLGLHLKAVDQTVDFKIPCRGETHFFFDQGVREIRLSGELCQSKHNKDLSSSEVVNVSNGFVATVFPGKLGHFTTDYISLAKGVNHIVVRNHLASGQFENHEYLIERSP